ncbi:hypothetical protein LZC95_19995 [Pendulispora brunnea]|uniref:Tail fiber protein n=1 Tax=Pendulispora brunnea TaxID=2905690 RepID=A0ABZ2KK94_9BACT
MPEPPYARVLVRINGGAPQRKGITAPGGASVQCVAESTVDWRAWRWELTDYPEGFAAPAGWALDPDGVIFSSDISPKAFSLPDAQNAFGKWLIRLTVNDGVDERGLFNPTRLVDESTAIETLSPFGLHDLGAGESEQFGGARKLWVAHWQANLRRLNAMLGPVATPSGNGFAHITNGVYDGEARLVRDADIVGPIDPAKVSMRAPTGTGFAHVTNGAYDAAAKLVQDADVAPAAQISSGKVNFGQGILFPSGAGIGAVGGGTRRILITGEVRGNDVNYEPLNFGGTIKPITGGTVTLTPAEYATMNIAFTGALTSAAEIVFPAVAGYSKLILNATTGAFTLSVKTPSGPSIPVPRGGLWVFCDGTKLMPGAPANGIVSVQAAHTTESSNYNMTNYADVPGLALTIPCLAGDKLKIESSIRLRPNSGYQAEAIVAVVDGAATVTLPETYRSRTQAEDEVHLCASTIYTVVTGGNVTVKEQYRSSTIQMYVAINPPSSLLVTQIRP